MGASLNWLLCFSIAAIYVRRLAIIIQIQIQCLHHLDSPFKINEALVDLGTNRIVVYHRCIELYVFSF